MSDYFVYILASRPKGVLYTGVTNELARRVWEHREGVASRFTTRYSTANLVWFERHSDIYEAVAREKRIKRWRRAWKLELVENSNPGWKDLYFEIAR